MRWQMSGLVLLPVLLVGQYFHFPMTVNLILANAIGAAMFWKIDKILTK